MPTTANAIARQHLAWAWPAAGPAVCDPRLWARMQEGGLVQYLRPVAEALLSGHDEGIPSTIRFGTVLGFDAAAGYGLAQELVGSMDRDTRYGIIAVLQIPLHAAARRDPIATDRTLRRWRDELAAHLAHHGRPDGERR